MHCKQRLAKHRTQRSQAEEYYDFLCKQLESAITRAQVLDTKPKARWPNGLGTRIYRIAELILEKCGDGD